MLPSALNVTQKVVRISGTEIFISYLLIIIVPVYADFCPICGVDLYTYFSKCVYVGIFSMCAHRNETNTY